MKSNAIKGTLVGFAKIVAGVMIAGCSVALCEESELNPLSKYTLGKDLSDATGLNLRGWLSGGVTFNGEGSNYNGTLSFNDRSNEFQMNQFYLVAERAIDKTSDAIDLGGRVDVAYGTDSGFTTALGWDDKISSSRDFYKLALPQAYVEAFLPIGSGLTVKAGHFYTLIGYEVVTAPDNFFYSHAYTMQYGEPFTHTGVLASYVFDEAVTLTAGVTKGWDNFEDAGKSESFLGSISWASDDTSVTFALTSGNEAPGLNRTMYSVVVAHQLCNGLKYVLQHDYGYSEGGSGVVPGDAAQWYGLNQYLTYEVSDELSVGGRVEWFRDDDGSRVVGLRSGTGGGVADYYGLTMGVNYSPASYMKIRPEVRYDYQDRRDDGVPAAFDAGGSTNQWTGAVDFIVQF